MRENLLVYSPPPKFGCCIFEGFHFLENNFFVAIIKGRNADFRELQKLGFRIKTLLHSTEESWTPWAGVRVDPA